MATFEKSGYFWLKICPFQKLHIERFVNMPLSKTGEKYSWDVHMSFGYFRNQFRNDNDSLTGYSIKYARAQWATPSGSSWAKNNLYSWHIHILFGIFPISAVLAEIEPLGNLSNMPGHTGQHPVGHHGQKNISYSWEIHIVFGISKIHPPIWNLAS